MRGPRLRGLHPLLYPSVPGQVRWLARLTRSQVRPRSSPCRALVALAEERVARPWWFVSASDYGRAWAMRESPGQFRIRGEFITGTALQRA